MVDPKDITIHDGNYKVIFSNVFNIYQDKLIISNIFGLSFEFIFSSDVTTNEYRINYSSDATAKKATINLQNFKGNPLGIGTVSPVKIFNTLDGRAIFFSLLAKSLNNETSLLQVSVTIYLK